MCDRLVSRDFDAWSEALARVGNCAKPVRLAGSSDTIDTATGEIISSYRGADEPLGVTYVRCGNRRASQCLSCSRVYAADVFHLIRAGVTGGKTVPASVADHSLVFATLTAPSFGKVHGNRGTTGSCHPDTRRLCRHGRSQTCNAQHNSDTDDGRAMVGQPLCSECYDYASHVVWQWWAPDLWRRFTIALRRVVAKTLAVSAVRVSEVATLQYAKVAKYQLRGAIHFHALVRLDGPRTDDGFAAAPDSIDAATLAQLVQQAARTIHLQVPGVDDDDPSRVLAFGRQLDVRPVRSSRRSDDPDQALTPGQVAGYLAKYATKSADDDTGSTNPHRSRLRHTVADLATRAEHTSRGCDAGLENPYELLGKWVAHAWFPRPLRVEVPLLLDHPVHAVPGPATRPAADRPNTGQCPTPRPRRPRSRPLGRRRHRNHPRHRHLALPRHRPEHRRRHHPRYRSSRQSTRGRNDTREARRPLSRFRRWEAVS